jgi:hypothetical protein
MGTAVLMQQERRELQQLSVMYGSHMAERAVVERSMFAASARPGGYKSSLFGLNHAMGRYEELTFADILNDPSEDPMPERIGFHSRMEKVYGL